MSNTDLQSAVFIELTADIVGAYVANNSVQVGNLSELIASVHAAVAGLYKAPESETSAKAPAVNPKKSVFPNYIICLEDGKRFKSLKRHIGLLGMTPDDYRAKWGLPRDYPMVAPNYAAARSELAKSMGLGRKPGTKLMPKASVRQNAAAKAKSGKRT